MKISSTMSRHAAKGIARGIEGRKEGWYPLPMIVHRAKTIEDLSHVSLPFATARIVTRSFLLPFLLSRSISLFNFHDRAIPGFIGKVHLFPTPPSSRLLCATRNARYFPLCISAPPSSVHTAFGKKSFAKNFGRISQPGKSLFSSI